MNEQLKQMYLLNGYCVVPDVLAIDDIQAIYHDVRQVFLQQRQRFGLVKTMDDRTESTDILTRLQQEMQELLQIDVNAYLGTLRLLAKLPSVRRLMVSERIEKKVCEIGDFLVPTVSESPVFHVISEHLRIPNGYFGFEPHQDWTSIQGALDVLVCWVPLVEVTSTNFPLMVIPSSHQKGMLPGKVEENAYKVDQDCIDDSTFKAVIAKPGDVVFMTGWTVHKTGVTDCSGFRLALSNRWEDAAEAHFVRRNYPSAYKRFVQREWITPNFPNLVQIQDAFRVKHRLTLQDKD